MLNALIGLVSIVCAVIAWRSGSRLAIRTDAAELIVNAITTVPGFFLDVSACIKLLTAAIVQDTVLAVVLMLRPDRSQSKMPPA